MAKTAEQKKKMIEELMGLAQEVASRASFAWSEGEYAIDFEKDLEDGVSKGKKAEATKFVYLLNKKTGASRKVDGARLMPFFLTDSNDVASVKVDGETASAPDLMAALCGKGVTVKMEGTVFAFAGAADETLQSNCIKWNGTRYPRREVKMPVFTSIK